MRHILLFILVSYNIVFIPLQMGFGIQFQGVLIFMEIMTIFLYLADALLTCLNYRKMQRQIHAHKLSTVSPLEQLQKKISHSSDLDEVTKKITLMRLDIITTLVAAFPFSWILQGVTRADFIVNLLRVMRLLKVWPFYRVIQILKKIDVNVFRLVEVIITYYLVAHVVSGVMLNVALTATDIRKTWMNRVPVLLPHEVREHNNLDGVSKGS